jgi:hypothetical protein
VVIAGIAAPRLLPTTDGTEVSILPACELIKLDATATAQASTISLTVGASRADAIFSTYHVPPHALRQLLLLGGGTVVHGPTPIILASLCALRVHVRPDCADEYFHLELTILTDGPFVDVYYNVAHMYDRNGAIRAPAPTLIHHTSRTSLTPNASNLLRLAFFATAPHRAMLIGRLLHVHDMLAPACAPPTPLRTRISAVVSYTLPRPPLARGMGAGVAVTCTRTYTTDVLDDDSEYALEVAAPAALGTSFTVAMTYDGCSLCSAGATCTRQHNASVPTATRATDNNASALCTHGELLRSVHSTEHVHVQRPSFPGAEPPAVHLQPVYLMPMSGAYAGNTSFRGRVSSMLAGGVSRHAEAAGAFIIQMETTTSHSSLTQWVTATTAGGLFAFEHLPIGSYVLRVVNGSLPTSLSLVGATERSVLARPLPLSGEAPLTLVDVLLVAVDDAGASAKSHVALSWDTSTAARLDLLASFAVGEEGNICEVSSARRACGGAHWETTNTRASAVVTFDSLPSAPIATFLSAEQQTCHGYGRASSSELPGGSDAGVDCACPQ